MRGLWKKIMGQDGLKRSGLAIADDLCSVSFEFFPPKNAEQEKNLCQAVDKLATLQPKFMTVTYGAGGTTKDRTRSAVLDIARRSGIATASHLTCVAAPREEINAIAQDYWDNGIRHIIALRGDMPGGGAYAPHPQGYVDACDLTAGLKKMAAFELSVACYPEKHPESSSLQADLDNLKRKFDAGADRAISQFFFDPVLFEKFLENAAQAGIDAPIVPGILPINNISQVIKFSAQCGASVPKHILEAFEGLEEDPETRKLIAVIIAIEQCKKLLEMGVRHLHFYTLNRADIVFAVCHALGIKPAVRDVESVQPQEFGKLAAN